MHQIQYRNPTPALGPSCRDRGCAVCRDVNKAGSFKAKAKAKSLKAKAKAKSLKAKARSLKAKTKAKARDQG